MPLPSRNELCEFSLKPVSHSVKDIIQFIKDEDGGVERAAIYNTDGNRISQSTPVEILMQSDFKIVINEREFEVIPPKGGRFFIEKQHCIFRTIGVGLQIMLRVLCYKHTEVQKARGLKDCNPPPPQFGGSPFRLDNFLRKHSSFYRK